MLLKTLKLKNIRSYRDEEVTFRTGSTLLSGDIGSGKSSLLLAIEFTLFGLQRGRLSGDNLLRHGEKQAEAVLQFSIDGKEVEVKRTLEKKSGRVQQGSGHVIVDGTAEEGTARELKSKVLELLGYPKNLLTKNPDIFRYTVYTPQEKMQKILHDDEEDRLVEIRRVFDLEKYKRVKTNAGEYAKDLRREKKQLEQRFEGLDEDKEQLEELTEEREKTETKLENLKDKLQKKSSKLESVKDDIETYELTLDGLQDLQNTKVELSKDIKHAKNKIQTLEQEIQDLQEENKEDSEDLKKPDAKAEEVEENLDTLKDKRTTLEKKREKIQNKLAIFKNKIQNAKDLIEDIEGLDTCPTCGQKVTDDHVEKVRNEEQDKIRRIKKKQTKFSTTKDDINEKLTKVQDKIDTTRAQKEKIERYQTKKKYMKQEEKRRKKRQKKITTKQKQRKELQEDLKEKKNSLEDVKEKIQDMEEQKQKIEDLQDKKEQLTNAISDLRVKKKGLEKDKQQQKETIDTLTETINEKQAYKEEFTTKRKLENWLTSHFVNVIDTIEKHVFRQIHHKFNSYFQEWFNILIEQEDVNVHLDETFSPQINQNGFETTIQNLSGGETTSVALAYRLGLNKVVNEFLSGIKTDNLIILDEPTDGFSAEQLDKVRDVIEALDNDQTILVSHEPKLESYVENVIEVEKTNHVSTATSYE